MAQKFLNGVLVTGDAPSTFTSTTTMDFNLVANPPELNFEDTTSTSGTKRARWTLDSNIFSADALSDDDQSVTYNLLDFNLSSGYATFANRVSAGESFNSVKDGADTVADGPFFALKNAAGTRQYINQLDASNNIDYWYYNGSTWTQTISLLTNGGATFTGSVTAVGISSTIASATSGYFATSTAIPANQIVHVRDNVATVNVSSAGGVKISSSPGNDVFLLKRWDHSGSASYFALQNSSGTEFITTNMATGNATFAGDVTMSKAAPTLEISSTSGGTAAIILGRTSDTKARIKAGDALAGDLTFSTGGSRRIQIANGGGITFNNALTATSAIFAGTVTINGAGAASYGGLNLVSSDSFIRLNSTGGTTDKQKWDIRTVSASGYEALDFRTVNDANDSFSTKLSIAHSGAATFAGTIGSGAITSTSAVTGTRLVANGTGNAIELNQSTTGSATYYVMDNTVETGGKRYRFGYSGGSSDKGSFSIYNQTDSLMPLLLSGANATFAGTITAAGGSSDNNDNANILTLNASEHARLLVDTSSTDGHRATLALESNGNELTLGTTGSASYLDPVGELTISGQVIFPSAATTRPVLPNGIISRNDNSDTEGRHDIWGISERYYPSNSTTADAWGIQWSGAPNDIVFVGGGADVFTVSLDEGNITALGNVTADYGYFNAESLSQDLRVGGIYGDLGLYVPDTYDMQFSIGTTASKFKFTLADVEKFVISPNGDGEFAGKLGVGGKTPAYGLTLAQGTGVNNKIAWTDATPSFRASMWSNSSDDKFKIATGNASSEETIALEIDTSQKVTFKGDVTMSNSKKLFGGGVHYKSIYQAGNPNLGFLIETDVTNGYGMFQGRFVLEQFNFNTKQVIEFSATVTNTGAVHTSKGTADINTTIKIFVYNSKWYVWIPSPSTYVTCTGHVMKSNAYQGHDYAHNSIVNITAAAVPSSGVTASTDIVCKFAQGDVIFPGDVQIDGSLTGAGAFVPTIGGAFDGIVTYNTPSGGVAINIDAFTDNFGVIRFRTNDNTSKWDVGMNSSNHFYIGNNGVNTALEIEEVSSNATFASHLRTNGALHVINASAEVWTGDSLAGTHGGFMKWNSTSNYLYIGNSYNSAYNEDIKIDNTGRVTFGGNVVIDSKLNMTSPHTQLVDLVGDSGDSSARLRIQFDSVNDDIVAAAGPRTFIGDGGADIVIGTSNSSYTPSNSFISLEHGGKIRMAAGASPTLASEGLTIDTSGNIGIGNQTPHGRLQFDNGADTRKIVLWEGADNDYQFYGFGVESSTLVYSTYSAGDDHVFFVGTSASARNELMRVKSTGDVVVANDVFSDGLYVNSASAVSGTQVAIVQDGAQNLQRWGTANSGQASYRFRIDQDMKFIANSGSGDNLTIYSDTGNLTTSGAISASNVSGTNTGDGADSYLAGDEVFAAHEHEEINADSDNEYKRMAKVTISKPGTATIKFEAYIQSGTYYWSYAIARNNGTNVSMASPSNQLVAQAYTAGLASGVSSNVHVYRQYDLDVAGLVAGDQIELWMRSSSAGGAQETGNGQSLYAKKFRMSSIAPTVESNAFLHGTTTISHVAEDERYGGESWSKYLTFDAAHSGGGGLVWSRQGTSYNRGMLSNHGDFQLVRTQNDGNNGAITKDFVILNDGKVGISNATPAARLTIGSAQGKTLDFSYSTNNGYVNNISNYWNSSTDTRMDFNVGPTANTAPTTIMSVGYGGNVGVKIIAPLKPLHVYAPDAGGNIRLTRAGTSEYHDISPYYSYTNGNSADFGTTSVHKTFLTTASYNALEINPEQEVSLLGYRGADGFALPHDENTGYSNFSAGGFGILFRETRDNYILSNAYYYKTGGTAGWRAKYGAYAASIIAQDEGNFNFQTAPANTTSPHALSFTANRFVIRNTGNIGVNAELPRNKLTVFTDGSAEEEVALRLVNPIGFDNAGSGASIIFGQDRSQTENYEMAKIRSTQVSGGSSVNGGLIFSTRDANTMTDRLTIKSNGNIVASEDEDKAFEIGRAHVGYIGHDDYAGFSHIDRNSGTDYAILQGTDGTTYLNSKSSTNVRVRSGNVDKQMFLGEYFGLGNTNPRFFLHSNQDVSSLANTSRYLTFSGTGAYEIPQAGFKQAIVYSANDNGTTAQPRNIGVLLHSDSTTDNTFTPLLGFGAKSDSGNFSQVVAGIAGKRLAYAGDTNWSGGELWFWTGRSDTIDGSAQGLPQGRPAMIMTSTRQVAIGTTSPAAGVKLDVQAEALFTSLSLKNNRINSGYSDQSDDTDIWINYEGYLNGTAYYRDFRVGNGRGGQIMMCDGSTSKVAIGQNASTSTAKLHVLNNGGNGGGGAVDHGILVEATSGQASIGAFHAGNGYGNLNLGSHDGAYHWHISKRLIADSHRLEYYYYAGGNHTSRYIFQANGDFHADGDVIAYSTTASDQKLKDNVETIDNALDKVCKLNGVSFTWNSGSRKGQRDLGVIAQNVEKVLPELVREKESPYHDDQTIKTVDYEKLTAVLIESVKELKAEIDELKKQIK